MSRPRDLQIWWIVLFAGGFWVAIWQHEEVAKLSKAAFNAVLAVTSNVRGTPSPQASPRVDSSSQSVLPAKRRPRTPNNDRELPRRGPQGVEGQPGARVIDSRESNPHHPRHPRRRGEGHPAKKYAMVSSFIQGNF